MKLQHNSGLLALVIIAALTVSMTTAKRGSRKSKKRDDPEPPSWKPNSNPAKGNSIFAKKAGQKIMFKCPADGNPKPKVKWFKNGAPIQKSDTGRVKERKFTLLLLDLQVSDQGNYTCEAFNKDGRIDWTYTLRVMMKEVIWPLEVEGPENRTVYEGESVAFECHVLNDPQAQIQWLRRTLNVGNGKSDSTKLESEKQMFIPTGENPEKLVLKNVTIADAGLYKCLVGNFNGLKYSDAWLSVLPAPKVQPKSTEALKKKKGQVTKPMLTAEKTTEMRKTPVTYTVPTTTQAPKKRPDKNRKLPMVTDQPRHRRPKLTAKPNQDNGRGRGSKRKTISPLDTPLMTMSPRTRPPKRKDMMKNKKDKPVFVESEPKEKPEIRASDKPDIYNMPPVEEDESNDIGNDKALADSAATPPATINLWTVYIIVGAVAGGILLIGLVTLIVAVACARREEGPYKSTTV